MRRLAVLVLIAGCGDGALGIADFPDAFLDARCSYEARCGLFQSADACRTFEQARTVDSPNPEAAQKAGKLHFDAAAAQACLDVYKQASCDATLQAADTFAVCSKITIGTVAQGGACGFNGECESNNCQHASCPDACCTGTCQPAVAQPDVGQPCTLICIDGAFCGVDSICHANLPEGAACTASDVCGYGLYCAGDTASTSGACRPLPHTGEACEEGCALLADVCVAGCTPVGFAGASCTSYSCAPGFTCVGAQCVALPALGEPCQGECAGEAWCNANTCVARLANGSPCMRFDQCASHFCAAGACTDVQLCI